ncbi:MAG: anaerobic ribonucleoside-triphosphate reductase [Acidaminococcaceae bacterium]
MNYEFNGVMVFCPEEINEQEAVAYLQDQLQVMPHKTLLSMDLELDGDDVVIKPHYDSIVRVRRITGYLSTLPRFNDAKKQEANDRVTHL